MLTARLIARSHLSRTILVEGGPQPYTIRYWPWGLNSESVFVDGMCAARRSGGHNMTGGFRFRVGDFYASLIVAVPFWCELLPLRDLTFVQLEINDQVIYEEGRRPKRRLAWTSPQGGFPVIADDVHDEDRAVASGS
jgi:hypothetical protein